MQPSQRVQNIPAYFYATLNQKITALKAQGADIIRLDAGSPDLPPAAHWIDVLKHSADNPANHSYGGYIGQPNLRQAIATYYGRRFGVALTQAELVPLIGSKEGLVNMHLAWLDPGDLSLIPDPGYSVYRYAPLLAGGHSEPFKLLPERNWLPNLADIPTARAQAARMLWLNYPNNPTGAAAPLAFFAEAVDFCRQFDILLCHDAPYVDVTFNGYRAPSLLEVPGAKEVAVEFNSLSKTYNMAGWRIGMAVGNPVAIEALTNIKTQVDSGIAKPIQDMAANALSGDQSWVAQRNSIYQQRLDLCLPALRQMGLHADVPQGGFYIWLRVPAGYSSQQFHQKMLEEAHVSSTPGHVFGQNGEGWLRLSLVAGPERLKEAMARIERLVG